MYTALLADAPEPGGDSSGEGRLGRARGAGRAPNRPKRTFQVPRKGRLGINSGYTVGIVGAATPVGQEVVRVLGERRFPLADLRALTADHSAGQRITVGEHTFVLREGNARTFQGVDLALFVAGADDSSQLVPIASRAGALIVDASPAFRNDAAVPLVAPEVNLDALAGRRRFVALPGPVSSQVSAVLYPLQVAAGLRRVIVDTYQAASDVGRGGVEELTEQVRLVLGGRAVVSHIFPHQLAFNALPEVDVFLDNGYSREEWLIAQEVRRVLRQPDLAVSVTAVRVPVYVGNAAALHVELERRVEPHEAREIFSQAGLRVLDDPSVSLYPHPWMAAGQDEICVGRIREDASLARRGWGLALWVVADNVRRTALAVVRLAEVLIRLSTT